MVRVEVAAAQSAAVVDPEGVVVYPEGAGKLINEKIRPSTESFHFNKRTFRPKI